MRQIPFPPRFIQTKINFNASRSKMLQESIQENREEFEAIEAHNRFLESFSHSRF